MHIFLVRVRQRADQSLYLERKPNATTDDNYIAISHVWGTPETITETVVDGHHGVVQLSPAKRDILSILSRPDVCGFDWFWMDLFCIDQTESPTISIADQLMSIPHVYKSARCVKVLLEHPICAEWHATVTDLLISKNWDMTVTEAEGFAEAEVVHSQHCGTYMVRFDPWFKRLWTRQEGLYGQVLDIVPLNLIPCGKTENLVVEAMDEWNREGQALGKSMTIRLFLYDKLDYHGLRWSKECENKLYIDLVYRRRVDMANYGGGVGPAATYDPFLAAWRSGRVTTKPRDYVLALFPDMTGYIPPPNMRMMTFPELLAHALCQAPIKQRYSIATKVPFGMMKDATSLRESVAPWIFEQPNNIGDAYDSLVVTALGNDPCHTVPPMVEEPTLLSLSKQAMVEDIQLSLGNLPRILKLCTETMDAEKQFTFVSRTGLVARNGSFDDQAGTERWIVQQYLGEQFAIAIVPRIFGASSMNHAKSRFARLNISSDAITNIPESIFVEELRRYLVCMVCGTSSSNADVILQHASPCILSTPFGKVLAMLRLEEREALPQGQQELQVLCWPTFKFQGFLVASQTRTGATTVIGRTVVPSDAFCLEAVKQSLERTFPSPSVVPSA